jgi:hypothetical protein
MLGQLKSLDETLTRIMDACEGVHSELERLRMLREYELSAAVEINDDGNPIIVDTDRPKRTAF